MSGGYENRAAEVGAVRELVQEFRELALRRRETHVDHVEALLDRPAQAAEEHRAAALETGAEHADAVEEFVEQWPSPRLDALRPQRAFEIGDEGPTELGVRFGALDDSVQLPAGSRQLPCRARPGGRSRGEHSDQAGKPFNVVSAHHVTCSQDAGPGSFLPSNAWRSLSRHREMRLAIVPAGSSRASPTP